MSCQQLHLPLPPPSVLLFGLSCPFVHDKYSEEQKLVVEGFVWEFKSLFLPIAYYPAVKRKQRHFQKTLQDVGNKMPPHSVVLCSSPPPFFMSSEHPTMAGDAQRRKGKRRRRTAPFFLLLIFSSRRPRLSSLVLKFSPCAGSRPVSTPMSRGMEPTSMSKTYGAVILSSNR